MRQETLAVVTAELRIRLDRLARENAKPVPPPRAALFTVLDRYELLVRRVRAEGGAA